jgi:hypothetical protein
MRTICANISGYDVNLNSKNRIESTDIRIIEKVWITDTHKLDSTLYSGCYIKNWYNLKPKLRLMTINGVVNKNK